jgi:nucleotide-binding universal stress UspA family protein
MPVLLTLDESEKSLEALPHAARLAAITGEGVLPVHVLEGHHKVLPASHCRAVQAWAADAASSSQIKCLPRHGSESTAAVILRSIREEQANIVFMATRGAGALHHGLVGSVTMDVLHASPVPVVVTGPKIEPPKTSRPLHVLLATDGSPAAMSACTAMLAALTSAPKGSIRVTVLAVYAPAAGDPPMDIATGNLRQAIAGVTDVIALQLPVTAEVRSVVSLGGVDTAILAAAAEIEADMIWMGTRGHTRSHHLLLGSVALGVVSRSPVPVGLVRIEG